MSPLPQPTPIRLREYAKVLPWLRPHYAALALIIGINALSTVTGLLTPLLNQRLIDKGLLARDFKVLWTAALFMALLTLFGFLTNVVSSYLYVRLSASVLFQMRLALYRHLQRLSPRHHARARMGEYISRLNNDVSEVQRISADVLLALLSNVVFLAGATFLMIRLSPLLFLCSVAVIPVAVWLSRRMQQKLAAHVRVLRERSASIGSFLIESLTALRLTTLVNAQEREAARFGRENQSFVDALLKMQLTNFVAGAVPTSAVTLSTALVFLTGGWQYLEGTLTLGALVAFLAYHGRLLSPVQNLMSLHGSLVTGAVSLRRMFEVLEIPVEVQEPDQPIVPSAWRGEVEFNQVSFRYDMAPVLESVSFRLEPGSLTLLTGASGAGKSTIADLLLRLFDPSSGTVKLDGIDVRQIPLANIREQVALVEQTPVLFHGTIADNIAYARPDASEAELQAAARAASLRLPLETQVGERGSALSAGERQRIAIARALLRDARVLILDEPVSSLDDQNRAAIMDTLKSALSGRTALVITHDERGFEGAPVLRLQSGKIEKACSAVA
jgi:ATP-binding cassette, subfamily B, bacterial